jgi:hypothetical protein
MVGVGAGAAGGVVVLTCSVVGAVAVVVDEVDVVTGAGEGVRGADFLGCIKAAVAARPTTARPMMMGRVLVFI